MPAKERMWMGWCWVQTMQLGMVWGGVSIVDRGVVVVWGLGGGEYCCSGVGDDVWGDEEGEGEGVFAELCL